MHRDMRGFTLIELMIVVAIIAILSAIALPAYRSFIARSADTACLGEAKAYAQTVVSAMTGDYTIPNHSRDAARPSQRQPPRLPPSPPYPSHRAPAP